MALTKNANDKTRLFRSGSIYLILRNILVAQEQGIDRDLAEMALAHSVGSEVERAYRRSDMLERRRALMETWGQAVRGVMAGGNVVRISQGAAV